MIRLRGIKDLFPRVIFDLEVFCGFTLYGPALESSYLLRCPHGRVLVHFLKIFRVEDTPYYLTFHF